MEGLDRCIGDEKALAGLECHSCRISTVYIAIHNEANTGNITVSVPCVYRAKHVVIACDMQLPIARVSVIGYVQWDLLRMALVVNCSDVLDMRVRGASEPACQREPSYRSMCV